MIVKRLVAAGIVLWLGAALGACSPFAGYVADSWPHWAGGLPPDAPPRPGAPGYDEFIAHGEPAQNTTAPAADAANGTPPGATPSGAPAIAAASPPPGKAQSRKTPSGKNGKVQIGRVQSAPAAAAAAQERETPAPAEPVENPPADDTSVVKGGLY
ncbi:MAG: hypothetical protein WBW35_08890 [Xanthobacteraceae bacterium]